MSAAKTDRAMNRMPHSSSIHCGLWPTHSYHVLMRYVRQKCISQIEKWIIVFSPLSSHLFAFRSIPFHSAPFTHQACMFFALFQWLKFGLILCGIVRTTKWMNNVFVRFALVDMRMNLTLNIEKIKTLASQAFNWTNFKFMWYKRAEHVIKRNE